MALTKDERILLQGKRDLMTGLWIVPLQILDRPSHKSNNIHQVNGKENSINNLNVVAFSPVQDTRSISFNRFYFDAWPVITAKYINRIPKDEATIKVHLTQISKHT